MTIAIGIDPGLHCGIAWLECTASRPCFIGSEVVEIGHAVPVIPPRRIGGGRLQTEEREVDDADLRRMYARVKELFDEIRANYSDGPIVVTVERVERVTPRKRIKQGSMAIATSLHTAGDIGGEIRGLARGVFGVERVQTVTEAEWRKRLVGAEPGKKGDPAVKRVITSLVADWPRQSQTHERDAAGVAYDGFKTFR